MRFDYGARLEALTAQLVAMCQSAGVAMENATQSLLQADLVLAEEVIGSSEAMTYAALSAEESGLALLALQAPIGRNLRTVVSSIQIAADLDRMGALALHVAKIARRRHPKSAVPEEVSGYFAEMGRVAVDLADNARQVIESRDLGRARFIREADDAMDDLHRHLFTVLLNREWKHGVTAAVDVTLLSRYYERFADHAVGVSRRIIFAVTGYVPGEEPEVAPKRMPSTDRRLSSAAG
jgi:phosphate transport system protein